MDKRRPILLLEDYKFDQDMVERSLNELEMDYPLIKVSDGDEGLLYLKNKDNEAPVLILSDLNMPKMNGIEFVEIIKKDERLKDIPVVVFTTSLDETDKLDSYDLDVAGYIMKPVSAEKFENLFKIIDISQSDQ